MPRHTGARRADAPRPGARLLILRRIVFPPASAYALTPQCGRVRRPHGRGLRRAGRHRRHEPRGRRALPGDGVLAGAGGGAWAGAASPEPSADAAHARPAGAARRPDRVRRLDGRGDVSAGRVARARRLPRRPAPLITGITGQDGSYLAELLLDKGYEVHGMVRRASTEKFERIEHLRDRITLHQGDLLDQRSLVDTLRAARARRDLQPRRDELRRRLVGPADADRRVHRRRRHADARGDARGLPGGALLPGVVVARCSARCARSPQTEATPFYPRSPYGVAKAYGHFITVNYRESLRPARDAAASSSTTRAPRRGLEFVTRKITWHAAAIRHGAARQAARSATSTPSATGATPKDYVEAMWLMLQRDTRRGLRHRHRTRRTRVRECVEIAFDEAGLGDWERYVEIDPTLRPARPRSPTARTTPGCRGPTRPRARTSRSR